MELVHLSSSLVSVDDGFLLLVELVGSYLLSFCLQVWNLLLCYLWRPWMSWMASCNLQVFRCYSYLPIMVLLLSLQAILWAIINSCRLHPLYIYIYIYLMVLLCIRENSLENNLSARNLTLERAFCHNIIRSQRAYMRYRLLQKCNNMFLHYSSMRDITFIILGISAILFLFFFFLFLVDGCRNLGNNPLNNQLSDMFGKLSKLKEI